MKKKKPKDRLVLINWMNDGFPPIDLNWKSSDVIAALEEILLLRKSVDGNATLFGEWLLDKYYEPSPFENGYWQNSTKKGLWTTDQLYKKFLRNPVF